MTRLLLSFFLCPFWEKCESSKVDIRSGEETSPFAILQKKGRALWSDHMTEARWPSVADAAWPCSTNRQALSRKWSLSSWNIWDEHIIPSRSHAWDIPVSRAPPLPSLPLLFLMWGCAWRLQSAEYFEVQRSKCLCWLSSFFRGGAITGLSLTCRWAFRQT